MSSIKIILSCTLIIAAYLTTSTSGIPAYTKRYDGMSGLDFMQICLDNCAQCKRMFANLFNGPACAEACIRLNGKSVPDCEDIGSIAPFLQHIQQ